ncbi:MAG TPA: tetratricopeptide repeat protein [Candidatus Krumholzibacteria bacterium]|nr:tetratricopeptide repeat protein [Candidatus Krumholzibacteria bacterium]
MRRAGLLALLLLASMVAVRAFASESTIASSFAQSFASGNAAYEAGDYHAAIDRYMEVTNAGIVHRDLYYNLGNAYFKLTDMGHAVLWYERALALDPRNDDIRANLAVVRAMLRDQQLVQAHGGVRGALMGWHRKLSAGESVAVACVFYALFTLAALCLIFRRSHIVRSLYRIASWVSPGRLFGLGMAGDVLLGMATSAVLALVFAGSAYAKVHESRVHTRSVVLSEEVPVFSGPSKDSTIQFKIHEGTIVSVRDGREGWVRVDLPGDLSGWVELSTVEKI